MWGKWHEKEVEDLGNVKVKIETGIEGRTRVALVSWGFVYIPVLSAEFQLQWQCIKNKDVFCSAAYCYVKFGLYEIC